MTCDIPGPKLGWPKTRHLPCLTLEQDWFVWRNTIWTLMKKGENSISWHLNFKIFLWGEEHASIPPSTPTPLVALAFGDRKSCLVYANGLAPNSAVNTNGGWPHFYWCFDSYLKPVIVPPHRFRGQIQPIWNHQSCSTGRGLWSRQEDWGEVLDCEE